MSPAYHLQLASGWCEAQLALSHLSISASRDCQPCPGLDLALFDCSLPTRSSFPPVYAVMEASSLSSRPRTLFTPISYLVAGYRWRRVYSVASLEMATLSVLPADMEPKALTSRLAPSVGLRRGLGGEGSSTRHWR